MSKTVEQILLEKYYEFKNEVSTIIDDFDKHFDDLDPGDLIDLMDLMLFIFPSDNTERHLNELLDLKQLTISDEKKQQLIPICNKYVMFLNKVKRVSEQ
jgi:hypothetical protein